MLLNSLSFSYIAIRWTIYLIKNISFFLYRGWLKWMDAKWIPTFIVNRKVVPRRRKQNWPSSKFHFPYKYITVIRLNFNGDFYNETWYQQMMVKTTRIFYDAQLFRWKKAQLLITLQFDANFTFSDFNLGKNYFTQYHHIKYINIS